MQEEILHFQSIRVIARITSIEIGKHLYNFIR